jgi:hypothetical protein
MLISDEGPMVLKVGHAHAGKGKIKFEDNKLWDDFRSVLELHKDYCSSER